MHVLSTHSRIERIIHAITELDVDASYHARAKELYTSYLIGITNSVCMYNQTHDEKYNAIYKKILTCMALLDKIKSICYDILKIADLPQATTVLLTNIINTHIPYIVDSDTPDVCDGCGYKMTIIPDTSEMMCTTCARIVSIVGFVFNDNQYYGTDMRVKKVSGFKFKRHYKLWIERIQGIEKRQPPEEVKQRLERLFRRDNVRPADLTYRVMRTYLKMSQLSKWNNSISSLIVYFGGPAPPRLTYSENNMLANKFARIMELYERIERSNMYRPYYPYFIYKLISTEFANDPAKIRLIDYIHLQSRATVIKNDIYYKRICDIAEPDDGLWYEPTDTSRYA